MMTVSESREPLSAHFICIFSERASLSIMGKKRKPKSNKAKVSEHGLALSEDNSLSYRRLPLVVRPAQRARRRRPLPPRLAALPSTTWLGVCSVQWIRDTLNVSFFFRGVPLICKHEEDFGGSLFLNFH